MGVARAGRSTPGSAPRTTFGSGHGRAGVAGGDKAGALALAHQLEADAHRAVLLAADGVGCLLVHPNALGGVVDDDGQVLVFEVLVEQVAEFGFRPDEMNANRQGPAGQDRPPDLGFRRFVGAYGVERDVDEHRWERCHRLAQNYFAASLVSSTCRPL